LKKLNSEKNQLKLLKNQPVRFYKPETAKKLNRTQTEKNQAKRAKTLSQTGKKLSKTEKTS